MAARVLLADHLNGALLPFVVVVHSAEKGDSRLISSGGVHNVKEELMLLIEEIFND